MSVGNFLAAKRLGTKEQVIGIDGMDSMAVHTVGARSHGIRAWEVARSDVWERKQREQSNRNQQHLVQQRRNEKNVADAKQKKEEKKRQEEADQRYFLQTRQELEGPVRVVATAAAAVEDDATW